MNNQKIMQYLFIIVPVLLVLSIWWNGFAPFLSLALVYLMILFFRNGWSKNVFNKQPSPTVYYQPTQQQPTEPEPLPRTNLTPSFDLTPQEYQQLSKQYQQGYQAQPPTRSTGWSPFTPPASDQPKQDPPDHEQPLIQYPADPLM